MPYNKEKITTLLEKIRLEQKTVGKTRWINVDSLYRSIIIDQKTY